MLSPVATVRSELNAGVREPRACVCVGVCVCVEDPTFQAGTLKSLLNNSNYIKGSLTMSQAVS